MKRILNHLLNPVVVIMFILFVIFSLKGCASTDQIEMPEKNESIAIPADEPLDPMIRDQVIIRVWECMFSPGSCSESTQ
tara:strand:- start:72 stop:308 length:237 start_codon:yes stop_codon:yes gene_type:complete